jgi:hypothetical protein
MANLPIQRSPNVSSEQAMTITVVSACEAAAWEAMALPKSAARGEKARPTKASASMNWETATATKDTRL